MQCGRSGGGREYQDNMTHFMTCVEGDIKRRDGEMTWDSLEPCGPVHNSSCTVYDLGKGDSRVLLPCRDWRQLVRDLKTQT